MVRPRTGPFGPYRTMSHGTRATRPGRLPAQPLGSPPFRSDAGTERQRVSGTDGFSPGAPLRRSSPQPHRDHAVARLGAQASWAVRTAGERGRAARDRRPGTRGAERLLPIGLHFREHRLFSSVIARDRLRCTGRMAFGLVGGRFGYYGDWAAIGVSAFDIAGAPVDPSPAQACRIRAFNAAGMSCTSRSSRVRVIRTGSSTRRVAPPGSRPIGPRHASLAQFTFGERRGRRAEQLRRWRSNSLRRPGEVIDAWTILAMRAVGAPPGPAVQAGARLTVRQDDRGTLITEPTGPVEAAALRPVGRGVGTGRPAVGWPQSRLIPGSTAGRRERVRP